MDIKMVKSDERIVRSFMQRSSHFRWMLDGSTITLDPHLRESKISVYGKDYTITPSKQLSYLESLFQNPLTPGVTVIGSRIKHPVVYQIALKASLQAYKKLYKNNTSSIYKGEVFWHHVMGGERDRVRDNPKINSSNQPAMLILYDAYAGMESNRRGKILDLINKFRTLPIVVLSFGSDPAYTAIEELHLHKPKIIHVGPAKKETVI